MKYGIDYHPKCLIIEHFDEIVSKLDIFAETKLLKCHDSPKIQKKINLKREDFIYGINYIQRENLDYFEANESEIENICSGIQEKNTNLKPVDLLELIRKEIIKHDCILIKNRTTKKIKEQQGYVIFTKIISVDIDLGYTLVCTSWYIDLKSAKFLEYMHDLFCR